MSGQASLLRYRWLLRLQALGPAAPESVSPTVDQALGDAS